MTSPVPIAITHAGGALAHLQDAKPDIRIRSPFKMLRHQADQIGEQEPSPARIGHLRASASVAARCLSVTGRLGFAADFVEALAVLAASVECPL
jgi:hypothetical protein